MAENPSEQSVEAPSIPFNRGDVVMLKSGGPKMTVEAGTAKAVHAVWFDGSTLKKAIFLVESIKASEN